MDNPIDAIEKRVDSQLYSSFIAQFLSKVPQNVKDSVRNERKAELLYTDLITVREKLSGWFELGYMSRVKAEMDSYLRYLEDLLSDKLDKP